MDLTDYDHATYRIEPINAHLACLERHARSNLRQFGSHDQERTGVAAMLDHLELRYGYDAALLHA